MFQRPRLVAGMFNRFARTARLSAQSFIDSSGRAVRMNDRLRPLQLQVWGDAACFTRPEHKVERVSYSMMTPSAARGVLEAVFWRRAFRWRVESIAVLKDISYFSIVRNEVTERANARTARGWAEKGGGFFADSDKHRSQRHTLALRDVAYRITASIELRPGAEDDVAKYRDQFRRRVSAGRCFSVPYLGCREFAASFSDPDTTPPIDRTEDLGAMLHDLEYDADGSGRGKPRLFAARMDAGVLHVPSWDVEEVRHATPTPS